MKPRVVGLAGLLVVLSVPTVAKDSLKPSPEAPGRTYAQNYKDMVLSLCVATAYKQDPGPAADAGSSFSALRDWTYYDLEKSAEEMQALVDRYLRRDYGNPLAEAEAKGLRFDLLKCFDLYHSKELDAQVKRLVPNPNATFRKDPGRRK